MIVVDTNIIAYFFITSTDDHAIFAENLFLKDPDWAAPVLWRSEFSNLLAHYIRKDILSLAQAQEILREALRLMRGREYVVISSDVLRLVARSACSAYDCEFVALAEDLGVPLVTADKKLAAGFPRVARLLGREL